MNEVLVSLRSETHPLDGDFLLQLHAQLSKEGIGASLADETTIAMEKGPAIARRIGSTRFLLNGMVCESIIPGGSHRIADALDLLGLYAKELFPTTSLTIVDPYFFGSSSDLEARFDRVIGRALPPTVQLKIVHLSGTTGSRARFSAHVSATYPGISLTTQATNNIHDRFWIADGSRGLVVGTSLNGFGSKFCFVENLSEMDVLDVVEELRILGVTMV
ncbi:hypothetical protein [Luteolibacter sp. Populi]|uniref:hypothetical protein n=1 Tax=Luteolibacter sp. Populi TaxID=3230487 RepID=UPI0034655817